MSRTEHLQWCKDRAMAYVNDGDLQDGVKSMMSDMTKHPETCTHMGIELGIMMLMGGHLKTKEDATVWILGFN